MIPLLSIVLLGFVLGMRHATDPDHVAAVTTIVSREGTFLAAAPVGLLWGLGHMVTIVVVGGAIVLFGIVIPPHLGLGMEFSVALMLVLLGGWNLTGVTREARRLARARSAGDPHDHEPWTRRDHVHEHPPLVRLDRLVAHLGVYRAVQCLLVGVVHGLAGSASVALLVLGTIRDPLWAMVYLVVFGVGTIAGMLLITMALAMPFALTASRFERSHRTLGVASSLLCLAFGAFLVYEIGFAHGLFTDHPQWTPK